MRAVHAAAAIAAIVAIARPAVAQNEGALRAAFEGRTVALRIDMPATSQGVDVYPQDAMPVDFRVLAQRMKDNGTAVKMGTQIMVTKVVVKKDHLEFQLGGGGYGTFGDWMTNSSSVSTASAGETQREKDLKSAIKNTEDKDAKKRMERELDNSRSTRERENSRAAAEAAQANQAREANMRTKRAESGSRFNIHYRQGIPPEALTAEGVMRALEKYLEFPGAAVASTSAAPAPIAQFASNPGVGASAARGYAPAAATAAAPQAAAPNVAAAEPAAPRGVSALRKGLTLKEVETILGPASTASEVKSGTMTIQKRTYRQDGLEITASFVSGVLIDFVMKPV